MISETGNNFVARVSSLVTRKPVARVLRVTRHERRATGFTSHESRVTSHGFTLIEVLLSVAILAIGLSAVIGSYQTVLDAQKRADFVGGAYLTLQQKLTEGRMEILSNKGAFGTRSGTEGNWEWLQKTGNTELNDVVELNVEVVRKNTEQKLTAVTYVRK